MLVLCHTICYDLYAAHFYPAPFPCHILDVPAHKNHKQTIFNIKDIWNKIKGSPDKVVCEGLAAVVVAAVVVMGLIAAVSCLTHTDVHWLAVGPSCP